MSRKYFLTVTLFYLCGTSLCQASGNPPKDFNPGKVVTKRVQEQPVDSIPLAGRKKYILKEAEFQTLTPKDSKLKKLAKIGNPDAMNRLGFCLLSGIGCNQDQKEGYQWVKKASEKYFLPAMHNLADCLQKNLGCEENPGNKKRAFELFKEAAEQEFGPSMNMMGWCFEKGLGCEISAKSAFEWYKRAAFVDNDMGMNNYGLCLQQGFGCEDTEENKTKAIDWFIKSSLAGNSEAMNNFGYCLENNIGFDSKINRYEAAVMYYEQSVSLGNTLAMNNLGRCLEDGIGCPVDRKRAQALFIKASETGLPSPVANLGVSYFVDKNYKLALDCLIKVKDEYRVNRLIGFIHLHEKNYEKALISYEAALASGELVRLKVIEFLRKKVEEAKKRPRALPKSETKNLAQEGAKMAQQLEVETNQSAAERLYEHLLIQLDAIKSGSPCVEDQGLDAPKEIENLNKIYKLAFSNFDDMETHKKLERMQKLIQFLNNLEEKIQLQEQKKESENTIAELRKRTRGRPRDLFQGEIESRQDRNFNKESKETAAKVLSDEKSHRHARKTRKHAKPAPGKVIAKASAPQKAEPEVVKGPFANIKKPIKRTKAELTDAAWDNVYKVRDTIRESLSMDDAKGKLNNLPGGFKFTDITKEYGRIPNAKYVFEARADGQYRIIVAFIEVKIQVLEEGTNNPVEKTVYQLYGDTIYIDDLH